jgi:excisionase family DNA binding protein
MGDMQRVCVLIGSYRPTLVAGTVIAWIKAGRLKGVKVGKFWYVDRDDVDALFAPRQHPPAENVRPSG